MESGFDFSWPRGQRPWLTFPDGSTTQLEVVSRVPLWPLDYAGEAYKAGLACPSAEGGSSGSGEAPGKPASANKQDTGQAEQQEEEESAP